jgi:hypothetical protein
MHHQLCPGALGRASHSIVSQYHVLTKQRPCLRSDNTALAIPTSMLALLLLLLL